jgi:RHS repeat-associated protein
MALEYIYTSEGRIRLSGTNYHYDYYLKDHLGNTRVVFTDEDNNGTLEVLQTDHYYPFGMQFNQGHITATGGKESNYLYNGKEFQEDLDWYDYGARFYDPSLARFTTVDPWAEKYSFQSPYAYAVNNPILFIDKDGKGPGFGPIISGQILTKLVTDKQFRQDWVNGWKQAATLTDLNDATVIGTTITRGSDAINIDGTAADGFDKAGAVIGAVVPFVGGKIISKALKGGAEALGLTDNAAKTIKETVEGTGNITSKQTLTGTEALDAGIEFVGKDATEIGKPGSGVYRSSTENANGTTNQFRMDKNSLEGNHAPNTSHVHLEQVKAGQNKPVVNNHIKIEEN